MQFAALSREGAAFSVLLQDNNCNISRFFPIYLIVLKILLSLGEEEQELADHDF